MPLFSFTRRPAPPSEARFRPEGHVVAARHGDRTVLLDYRRARYYGLDEVGSRIWTLLGEGKAVDAIVESLGREYDVPSDRLREDTRRLVEQLCTLRLLRAA